MERRCHPGQYGLALRGGGLPEVFDVATDGQGRAVAADQHRAHGRVFGGAPCGDQRIVGQLLIDGVAHLGSIEADRGHAVGHGVVDGGQRAVGTQCLHPGRGVGQLIQAQDPTVVGESQDVHEFGVQCAAADAGMPAVVAPNQEPPVIEPGHRLGLRGSHVVPGDHAPQIAAHGRGPVVHAAGTQRESVGGVADEVRVQQ